MALAAAFFWAVPENHNPTQQSSQRFSPPFELGEALLHGATDTYHRFSVTGRMPLTTVLEALLLNHSGLSLAAYEMLPHAAVALLVFAVGTLAYSMFCGLAAAAALPLVALPYAGGSNPEAYYSVLLLVVAGLISWRDRKPGMGRTLLLSLGLSASLLYRSPLILLPPLLAVFDNRAPRAGGRVRLERLVLCVVPYLALIPWAALNKVLIGRFTPFEVGAMSMNIVAGVKGLVHGVDGNVLQLTGGVWLDLNDNWQVMCWAAREILDSPISYLYSCAARFVFALGQHPWLSSLALAAALAPRATVAIRHIGLMVAYYLAIHASMAVMERYFLPVWPLLLIVAASLPAQYSPKLWSRLEDWGLTMAKAIMSTCAALVFALAIFVTGLVVSFAIRASDPGSRQAISDPEDHPSDAWLWYNRGLIRLKAGQFPGAAEDLSKAARLRPEDPQIALQSIWARALTGSPADLLAWTCPQDCPDLCTKALLFQAHTYLLAGRNAEARQRLIEALWRQPLLSVVYGPGEKESSALERLRSDPDSFANEVESITPWSESAAARLFQQLSKAEPSHAAFWDRRASLLAERAKRSLP